jgi:hypothetical protein
MAVDNNKLTMLCSHGSGQQQIDVKQNAGKLLAISIAMRMRRCDEGHITQWSTSRASLESTVDAAIGEVPAPYCPGGPWSTNLLKQHKTPSKHNFKLATTVHFDH